MPEDLHGIRLPDWLANPLLNPTNRLRYGVDKDERMRMVEELTAPGVEEFATERVGATDVSDMPATERYTSSFLHGQKYAPLYQDPRAREMMQRIVGLFRRGEREKLGEAAEAGMRRGAESVAKPKLQGLASALSKLFPGEKP
jgi:hypothetical protein